MSNWLPRGVVAQQGIQLKGIVESGFCMPGRPNPGNLAHIYTSCVSQDTNAMWTSQLP